MTTYSSKTSISARALLWVLKAYKTCKKIYTYVQLYWVFNGRVYIPIYNIYSNQYLKTLLMVASQLFCFVFHDMHVSLQFD